MVSGAEEVAGVQVLHRPGRVRLRTRGMHEKACPLDHGVVKVG